MKFNILHQSSYSRGELLLRTFFGWLYIAIPHMIILYFLQIWSAILTFIAFFSILFSGKYPKNMFDFQVKYLRWYLRVNARLLNLSDGYPAFGLNAQDDKITFDVPYPEKLSVGDLILKALFGWIYVVIPHGIALVLREIVTVIYIVIAWFAVLFTGKYPEKMHEFNVGTLRWSYRVQMYYMLLMTDKYPPFNGKPDEIVD